MSTSIGDLKPLHAEYTRLTEKFKTYWTFHQFLQGIHKAFFGDAPGYQIDFQGLYDQIKNVSAQMTFQPPATVLERLQRLDLALDQIHGKLADDDRKLAPSYVRRFFEKVRTEDEKLLLALLRFYFFIRHASHDVLDKMDFLITLVGARRSIDDGRYLARFPQELTKLFGGFLGLITRAEPSASDVTRAVNGFAEVRRQIDACTRFEDLTERKILESLRAQKHELGHAFYDVQVLSAILETNLAAKNKFQNLYEEEEQRILESSRQLLELEKELATDPRFGKGDIQEEFRKFRQYKEAFERQQKDGEGVRHQEVTRLAETIDQLLSRLDLPPGGRTTPGPFAAVQPPGPEAAVAETATDPGTGASPAPAAPAAAPPAVPAAPGTADPLTADTAQRILYSVELIDDGSGTGKAAYGKTLSRFRLEPWEVRATRRFLHAEPAADDAQRTRDALFFEAATLRVKIEDEAQWLRAVPPEQEITDDLSGRLRTCGLCLVRAQELDRRFRMALEEAAAAAPPERVNEIHRSRFRLLRSFSGLWLLHNIRASLA